MKEEKKERVEGTERVGEDRMEEWENRDGEGK